MPNKMQVKPKLIEFMLLGSSIERLNKVGSGQREEEYYTKISEYVDLKIFGYSRSSGVTDQYELPVLFRNKWIQSFIGPFLFYRSEWSPDIIRTKQLWGSWAGWIARIITGAPLVIRCGYIWSKAFEIERKGQWKRGKSLPGLVEKWMIRRGDAYIFGSKEVQDYYSPFIKSRKSIVIPNMFNLDIFKFNESSCLLYDYLYVGRLIELKGVLDMMDYIPKGKKLLVIGSGDLEKKVSEYPGVTMIQRVKNYELPQYISQARYFLSLSHTEGHPKAAYEAVLCGLYPILSNIPAHKYLIEKLGYGKLVNKGDVMPKEDECCVDFAKLEIFRQDYCMSKGVEKEILFLKEIISDKRSLKS